MNPNVVVWGFSQALCDRHESIPSHAYIHEGYYRGFSAIGETVWLDDLPENADKVPAGALVFCCNLRCEHMPRRPDLYYVTHNLEPAQCVGIDPAKRLSLQYWFTGCPGQRVNAYTAWDAPTRTLYMPWATDLMPDEIDDTVSIPGGNEVMWVGSVWKENAWGNEDEIGQLKTILARRQIAFKVARVPADEHQHFIRNSVIAPAIVGQWQIDKGYIPCRAMKNASYGQMVITNSKPVAEFFDWRCVYSPRIHDLIDTALSTPRPARTAMTLAAKAMVRERHTYLHRAKTIMEYLG